MIENFVKKHNLPKYRVKQYCQHKFKDFALSYDEFSSWPKNLRDIAKKEIPYPSIRLVRQIESKDKKTVKFLFEKISDGKKFETVLMSYKDGRNSICVSCMIGCPVNCSFCATGKMGFISNLTSDEILDQIIFVGRQLKKKNKKLTNVVFMGMGEPLLNLENVWKSITEITDEEKIGMSVRRITLSTSGFIPQLKKLIKLGFKGRLAISLHAPNQKLREKLMPVAKVYKLSKLMGIVDEFIKFTNKRVSFEYTLIDKINDSAADALELSNLLKDKLVHVNLIAYNTIKKCSFKKSSAASIKNFSKILSKNNISNTIRITMGDEIKAACGQLVIV